MIKIEFIQPNVEGPFGTFKVDIGFPAEPYNYPLSFKVISDVSNKIVWETNNMIQGHWSLSGSPDNCTAYLIDSKGNIIDKLVWETSKHGDYTHREFLKWALKNKGAKGIAIGTHDGATGEWVVPIREGTLEGFLVEASDMQFNLLSENYKDIKNAHTIQNLVTKDGLDCEFYEGPDGYTNSVKKSHLSIFTDDIKSVKMKSISLNDLIIKCGLKDDLKWLHLDVEGIDDELIMSLDDSRVKLPEIIIYETLNLDDNRKKKVVEWLESKQYSCVEAGWNTIAVLNKTELKSIKIEFTQPCNTTPFGMFSVDIGFPTENYNYPLSFKVISDVSDKIIWETNDMWTGYWSKFFEPNNTTAYLIDSKGNILDRFLWETFKHGDYTHKEFLKWAIENKGAKGIAIGTNNGESGEWVTPIIDGLLEGFLVEASDKQFNDLKENYKDIKNAHTIQSLVTKDGLEYEFYECVDGPGLVNSVIKSHASGQFTNDVRTIKMKSISLNDLIIKCGLKDDLKWLHLDVEGIDDELIMSLDDSKVKLPEVIIYESVNLNDDRKNKVVEWLESKQYSCAEWGLNTIAFLAKTDLSLLIHTCDHYEKFWNCMFYTLDFYWDYDSMSVYFANEEKSISDIKFDCKGLEYRPDKRIKQILTGKTDKNGFSTRFIEAVKKIPTKYVLYMQEDMWLKRSLDKNLLDELIKFMDENNADSVRIHAKLFYYDTYNLEPTDHIICGQRLLKTKGPSFLSHNATIWRKDYILKYQSPGEDPWINEERGSERMSVDCDNHYHYNIHWYCQPGISENGEFSQEAVVYGHIVDEMKSMELKLNLKGT